MGQVRLSVLKLTSQADIQSENTSYIPSLSEAALAAGMHWNVLA